MWKHCCSLLNCCIFLCVHSRGEARRKRGRCSWGAAVFWFYICSTFSTTSKTFCLFWSTVALLSVTSAKCSSFYHFSPQPSFYTNKAALAAVIEMMYHWLWWDMYIHHITSDTEGILQNSLSKSDKVSRCSVLCKGVMKVFVFKEGYFNLS